MPSVLADLGTTALNALLTNVVSWGVPIVALAGAGILITYMFGREEWHSLLGGLARWVVGGAGLVGIAALAAALGI